MPALPDIVRQLLKTFAIVIVGGGLFYLAVAYIADVGVEHGVQYWLTLLLTVPLTLLAGWHLAEALRSGEMPVRLSVISRDRQSAAFWFAVVLEGVVLASLVALALYALAHIL